VANAIHGANRLYAREPPRGAIATNVVGATARPAVTRHPLPIIRTLAAAYRDWRRAVVALRALVPSAFFILVALSAADEFVPHSLWGENLTGHALDLVDNALWALLLTPVVIAVHRFVIQDVITPAYTLPLGDAAYQKFFIWLFALKVLSGLPFDLLGIMQALGWPLWASTFGLVVALIAAIGLSLRLTVLLPALAVQAPDATAAHAFADGKGQALRLFLIFFLALVPWGAVSLGAILLLGRRIEVAGSPQMMIGLAIGGLLQTIELTLSAVIASLAFRALAGAVNRAPKLALAHPIDRSRLD
jgi:hypothetical protein